MTGTSCARCGAVCDPSKAFCKNCGASLAPRSPEASPAQPSPQATSFVSKYAGMLGWSLVSGIVGWIVGWFVNLYSIAMAGGFNDVSPNGPIGGSGNVINAALIWTVGSAVLFGVIGHWRAVGTARFFKGVAEIPASLANLFRRDGEAARVHVLWGFAAALFASTVVSPWLSFVLAAGVMTAIPSALGRALGSFLHRLWSDAVAFVAPGRRIKSVRPESFVIALLGTCGALFAAFFVPSDLLKAFGAVLAAVVAFVLAFVGGGFRMSGATTAALLAIGSLFVGSFAMGDDGGWDECNGTIRDWLSKDGSGASVAIAGVVGFAGGIGGAVGSMIGGIFGNANGAGATGDGGTTSVTEGHRERLDRLWGSNLSNVGSDDPNTRERIAEIWRRTEEIYRNAAASGKLDERALAELEADHDRLAGALDAHGEQVRERHAQEGRDFAAQRRAEEAAEEARRRRLEDDLRRRQDYVDRHAGELTPEQQEIVNRIRDRSIDGRPIEERLAELERLTRAVGDVRTGESERQGAAADHDAIDQETVEITLGRAATAGQIAGNIVESALLPGSGGALTNAIYSGAGSWDKGVGTMIWNAAASGVTSFAGGRVERYLDHPIADVASGTLFGGLEAILKGEDPHDAAKSAAIFGGVLGGAGAIGKRLDLGDRLRGLGDGAVAENLDRMLGVDGSSRGVDAPGQKGKGIDVERAPQADVDGPRAPRTEEPSAGSSGSGKAPEGERTPDVDGPWTPRTDEPAPGSSGSRKSPDADVDGPRAPKAEETPAGSSGKGEPVDDDLGSSQTPAKPLTAAELEKLKSDLRKQEDLARRMRGRFDEEFPGDLSDLDAAKKPKTDIETAEAKADSLREQLDEHRQAKNAADGERWDQAVQKSANVGRNPDGSWDISDTGLQDHPLKDLRQPRATNQTGDVQLEPMNCAEQAGLGIAKRIDPNTNADDVNKIFTKYRSGADGGLNPRHIDPYLRDLGAQPKSVDSLHPDFASQPPDVKVKALREHFEKNPDTPILVDMGWGPNVRHAATVTGVDGQGRLILQEPTSPNPAHVPLDRISDSSKKQYDAGEINVNWNNSRVAEAGPGAAGRDASSPSRSSSASSDPSTPQAGSGATLGGSGDDLGGKRLRSSPAAADSVAAKALDERAAVPMSDPAVADSAAAKALDDRVTGHRDPHPGIPNDVVGHRQPPDGSQTWTPQNPDHGSVRSMIFDPPTKVDPATIDADPGKHFYGHDELGRPNRMSGWISRDVPGTPATGHPELQGTGLQRGHLGPNQYGGRGDVTVPMPTAVNQSHVEAIEKAARPYIEKGLAVKLDVEVQYKPGYEGSMPDSVIHHATVVDPATGDVVTTFGGDIRGDSMNKWGDYRSEGESRVLPDKAPRVDG